MRNLDGQRLTYQRPRFSRARDPDALIAAGHEVVTHELVRDETEDIRAFVDSQKDNAAVGALLVTGGTGISERDVTPEAVRPLFSKELPGFGERFRQLSWEQAGVHAVLSRATAGLVGNLPVFLLPGSPRACTLAVEKIIAPLLGHLSVMAGRGS